MIESEEPIRLERDIVAALERHFAGSVCLREFTTGHGRADLVVAQLDNRAFDERRQSGLAALVDDALLLVLDATPHDPVSSRAVAAETHYSLGYVRRLLGQLSGTGYVERTSDGYRRLTRPPAVVHEVVAIEAKVRDWTTGIFQCMRYMRFSDFVFLALPEDQAGRVSREQVRDAGIGLLSVSPGGDVQELVAPRRNEMAEPAMRMLANELVWAATTN